MSENDPIFAGPFTFFAAAGPYGAHGYEGWTFVEVPEAVAGRGTAQTLRENIGAQSAVTVCKDDQGRNVFWHFVVDHKDGGGSQYSKDTPREARVNWDRLAADPTVREMRLTRVAGGTTVAIRYFPKPPFVPSDALVKELTVGGRPVSLPAEGEPLSSFAPPADKIKG